MTEGNEKKFKILTVRLGPEEMEAVETLKGSPYFINISEFVRESIRKYYDSRIVKAGRVKEK